MHIFIEFLIASLAFLLSKILIHIIVKFLYKKNPVNLGRHFDFAFSLFFQLIFILGWLLAANHIAQKSYLSNIEYYISLCVIGISSVIWCYFSMDSDKVLSMPRIAKVEERRKKKSLIYFLILIFTLVQGYYQTRNVLYPTLKFSETFSVTNYAIILGAIAFDRFLNQVIDIIEEYKKRRVLGAR